jgi:hypothetical protein
MVYFQLKLKQTNRGLWFLAHCTTITFYLVPCLWYIGIMSHTGLRISLLSYWFSFRIIISNSKDDYERLSWMSQIYICFLCEKTTNFELWTYERNYFQFKFESWTRWHCPQQLNHSYIGFHVRMGKGLNSLYHMLTFCYYISCTTPDRYLWLIERYNIDICTAIWTGRGNI